MALELLSPAGSPEALRAAVQNGAGAVYLGWGDFNARRSAKNFSDEEFAGALQYCHVRGVRVFLTLNTLLTDRELPRAVETARRAARLGVDSILVQDWGLFDLLRKAFPDLPLHASTQMSVFTSGGACEVAKDGCERVVIARECSAEDTAEICRNCPAEIEIFGHGALCMCYSGQCEMSALIGQRSGNRGRCAQPCRLPYGVNGPARGGYPLSLKDSCLARNIAGMEEMGVACLKLEGRMKRPEYVAVISRIYARLLAEHRQPTAAEYQELEQAFSRSGFTDWYWQGKHGAGMFGTRPENAPDPRELFAEAKALYEKDDLRTVPVTFRCTIAAAAPAALTASDEDGHSVTVTGATPEAARSRAITAEEVETRLNKTGGTAFCCVSVSAEVEEGLSLPASAVNALRRDALSALEAARCAVPERRECSLPELPDLDCSAPAPQWTASVLSAAQLNAVLPFAPTRMYVPLELLSAFRALPPYHGEWCAVLPRVWRDKNEPELRSMLEKAAQLGVTGVLVGNIGHLSLVRGLPFTLYGDYGLNVFNSHAMDYLRQKGLSSACVSFELRFAQIRDLKKVLPAEAIVYGRLPLMITENCLVENACGCRPDGPNYLSDRTGARFPLLCAYGHRTEVQNSKPLWLADKPDWKHLGLSYARLRFTTESADQCAKVCQAYLDGAAAEGEFTRGLYERGVE